MVVVSEKDLLKLPTQYDLTLFILWFGIQYLWRGKNLNLWGINQYPFAISNQIDAVKDFLALASLNTNQTIDKCSQQPRTFSMQPCCTDKLMIFLF